MLRASGQQASVTCDQLAKELDIVKHKANQYAQQMDVLKRELNQIIVSWIAKLTSRILGAIKLYMLLSMEVLVHHYSTQKCLKENELDFHSIKTHGHVF